MKAPHKSEFKRLFRESFDESAAWAEWFADTVYRDEDFVSVTDDDGRVSSSLLLSRYEMAFHGTRLPMGYVSCVATAKACRGRGMMYRLIPRALSLSAERGDGVCALIPASDRLYFLYDRFGFATVYYIDELRYTALHAFVADEDMVSVEPSYGMFRRLEDLWPGTVIHSAEDYRNIVRDIELDGGRIVAVSGPDGEAAMAFVSPGSEATVKALMSTSERAADSVMALVRAEVGEKSVVVWGVPSGRRAALRSRGMARIVDADRVLSAIAASDSGIDQVIRVYDPLIPTNTGIYMLRGGECRRTDSTMRRITLDVGIDVLTRIVFSSAEIASVFGLPGGRPLLPLMLD